MPPPQFACSCPPAPDNNFSSITAVSPPSLCHEAEGSPSHVVCSPSSHAAALLSTRAAGGAASMHAAYEEEDECVLQHAGEEELACHCHLRPHGGGAHGGYRGGSRSGARRACKPGADAESTFETLNVTWILQSKGAIWVSRLL